MAVIILLDVDGVLNPTVVSDRKLGGHRLVLDDDRAELVRRLARVGTIVWATTWPPDLTGVLATDLGLPKGTPAIVFRGELPAEQRGRSAMGKLPYVARWLELAPGRGFAVDAVVWIDDNLTTDAHAWALEQQAPFHLVRPDAFVGLTADEVAGIEAFGAGLGAPEE